MKRWRQEHSHPRPSKLLQEMPKGRTIKHSQQTTVSWSERPGVLGSNPLAKCAEKHQCKRGKKRDGNPDWICAANRRQSPQILL